MSTHFSVPHSTAPTLFSEVNVHRYRPASVAVRVMVGAAPVDVARVRAALAAAGGAADSAPWSLAEEESAAAFAARLGGLGVERVRIVGPGVERVVVEAAAAAAVTVVDGRVVGDGRVELGWLFREQCVSRTVHRFGSVVHDGWGEG
jgi:RHH-type transcriptional regulator, proline utilization regulon repressor / proline dehydrogenase / delta 1-pyrroline-5-carboxylate dehydrogenase